MSAPEQVTIVVDGVSLEVPKNTPLVDAALAGGIEIPVFCYEPRLGPPIGACRMCLCEIEGMPKLQAACTMTAQDGMVIRTAQTSGKAAEGQEAVLEFILVNHPLDCPVCDKGGECPLQDLTFRWGPGQTRMQFPKRTLEKPIPISPAIALDRERCILCYRCTRFSESVAEDGQLIARNRGAMSVIATFEDRAYRAPFSGNVLELCPVGALTSTQYRFQARPWEIQNVPTVCGLCPVGCNISATTREDRVKRILSRNHPEVDGGWLCDKGRFAFTHLRSPDRIVDPLQRVRRRGFEPVSWDAALDEAERMLREANGRVVTALSGSETLEQAFALGRLMRAGLGSSSALLPEQTGDTLEAFCGPLSAIGRAEVIVVLGDDPVVERAPIVDLWIRLARRNGADVVTIGPTGDRLEPPGSAAEVSRRLGDGSDPLTERLRASERAVLIWSGPGGQGGAHLAALAERLGFRGKDGCCAFHLPATPNGRGVTLAWAAAGDQEPSDAPIGLLFVSGDEAASNPNVRALAERAERVIATTMFHGLAVGWADLVLPGTSYLERDGSFLNLEGRIQRLRRAVMPPVPDELAWTSKLAARFGVDVSPHPSTAFSELSALAFDGLKYGDVGEHSALRAHVPAPPLAPVEAEPAAAEGAGLRLVAYRPLFSGPAVERVAELQFQRPPAEIELSPADAARLGVVDGAEVQVGSNGSSRALRARVTRQLVAGAARIAEEHAEGLGTHVEVRP